MYPNLYYVFKDWFGVHWKALKILNSFGLMVALSFVSAAIVITSELKRKEKQKLLLPREETIVVGKPASLTELVINAVVGFIFGAKLIGLLFSLPPDMNTQEYIFSSHGSFIGGLVAAALMVFIKWNEKNKQKLKEPERRTVRIWPHDRVGDLVIICLVFGILGAKLFDNFEHWGEFMKDPLGQLFSFSGLTFYGGLIVAGIAVLRYGYKKGINLSHLADSAAPCMMIAYAVGRIGCQVAGDGDWGVYNSGYNSDAYGHLSVAGPGDFEKNIAAYPTYFLYGTLTLDPRTNVTDRTYPSLDKVPHKTFVGPSYLPKWLFAYSYPENVNNDGIPIPGDKEDRYSVLPQPVFPTPLYETTVCGLMFLFMWGIRRRIKTPLLMFGLYLVLNGVERFFIEMIRVNKTYLIFGIESTQAEEIAVLLILGGIATMIYAKVRAQRLNRGMSVQSEPSF